MFLDKKKDDGKINRYWDSQRKCHCVKILPGEYYFTKDDELIATTLGSCVSACVWDEKVKVGGMNHFMLPLTDKESNDVTWGNIPTEATRYGNYAMEYLINELIKKGGDKQRFKTKLFGGGKVLQGTGDVGDKNINFVLDYIKTEGLILVSQDLGDIYPRKVLFNPRTGQAWIKKIKNIKDHTIEDREKAYRESIKQEPISGDVDLF